ncbi:MULTISPECIES: hypothetical protein [Hyphobacterium]|uniref:Tetratricopeptide repeat protein n=1 Tax=Hyphobacterium vulgare TaxID=1736751 RepID=A0ABV6ZYB5_9PROT
MPILLGAHVLIAILCAIHALKTGRQMYWLFILFAFPGLGSVVYVVVEILPGLTESPQARAAGSAARRALDPGRELREARQQLDVARTPANLRRVGDAYLAMDRPGDALPLLQEAATGILSDDEGLLTAKARAEYGCALYDDAIATLEALKDAHPRTSMPQAHLLYARALEGAGRDVDALEQYENVSGYYPGAEARARWAMLLEKLSRGDEAAERWNEILSAARIAPKFARKAQAEWVEMARTRASRVA